jgi:RNA polymerase sigma-70 factor (ECF subfamily)
MSQDIQIIKSVLDGRIDCFETLVRRYQEPVVSMIANIVADRHMCEDIAQDAFLAAYSKLRFFDPARSEFSTWLFTIARNKAINAIKKKRPLTRSEPPESVDADGPAENLGRKEAFNLLDRAIQALPTRFKTVFVMAELENMPYHRIAQIEGISTGTVKSRVHRARKKLAAALAEYKGDFQ